MAGRTRRLQLKEQLVPRYLTEGIDQEGFEERFINNFIGRGVFTTKEFSKGQFLLEYKGELISQDEGSSREQSYDEDLGSFLFFFKEGSKRFCVDATFSSGLGRLVNDAFPNKPNCNCAMRKIKEGPLIYLALYALRDIMIGEELRYDYGVKDLPWRNLHAEESILVEHSYLLESAQEGANLNGGLSANLEVQSEKAKQTKSMYPFQ
ncbi:N-lysine methyltransferase KMT5A-B-like [Montipora foliosa]|uniref:N-lysine methyltransferase KMT5A-B-like n=1 Tax=Montipora foliosa TaxID=591990 RepID=UPI0035F1D3F9